MAYDGGRPHWEEYQKASNLSLIGLFKWLWRKLKGEKATKRK